jgi:glycosyltransferase involved in cell wall biosynthesis
MSSPLVSALLPAYNEEDRISRAIEALKRQTYENIEIVVVNDGSTDNTAQVVQTKHPDVVYIEQENTGLPGARNAAAAAASGELFAAMDADDALVPERIERQVEVLLKHPDAAAVTSNALVHRGRHTYPFTNPELPPLSEVTIPDILCGPCPPGPSVMVRAEVFRAIGGYDVTSGAWDDKDFFCRLILQGHKLLFLNQLLYILHHHPGNISSRSYLRRVGDYLKGISKLDPRRNDLPWRSPLTPSQYSWYMAEHIILAAVRACWGGRRKEGLTYPKMVDDLPVAPLPAKLLRTVSKVSWPLFGVLSLPYHFWLRLVRA